MRVRLKKLHEAAKMPTYAKPGDAGADLAACKAVRLLPMVPAVVPCGIAIELPDGYEAQIRPRSSSLIKHHIHVATGTIDSSYRGEIGVAMLYLGSQDCFWVQAGDRVAQMVVAEVARCAFEEANELTETERGEGGFGSTGAR